MAEANDEINEGVVARLKLEEDGSLSNKRVERYVCLLADGVDEPTAWKATLPAKSRSKKQGGDSWSYRKNIHRSPAFKARLERLMAEKAELTAENNGIWGDLRWQAKQLYRMAVSSADLKAMESATRLLLQVATKGGVGGETPAAAEPERGPGAPSVETPVQNANAEAMRQRMLDRPQVAATG